MKDERSPLTDNPITQQKAPILIGLGLLFWDYYWQKLDYNIDGSNSCMGVLCACCVWCCAGVVCCALLCGCCEKALCVVSLVATSSQRGVVPVVSVVSVERRRVK